MNNDYIEHYGIKGMRWGIRRSKERLARLNSSTGNQNDTEAKTSRGLFRLRRKKNSTKSDVDGSKKTPSESHSEASSELSKRPEPKRYNSIKEVPDAELRAAVERMRLEKSYRELVKELTPAKKKSAGDVVKGVLAESGKKVLSETTTYVMRNAVNAALKTNIAPEKKKK